MFCTNRYGCGSRGGTSGSGWNCCVGVAGFVHLVQFVVRMTTTSEPATASPGWENDEVGELDADDEPFVPVPAGLIAEAVELLTVCDELIGQRRGSCVNNQLREQPAA